MSYTELTLLVLGLPIAFVIGLIVGLTIDDARNPPLAGTVDPMIISPPPGSDPGSGL